MNVRYDIVRKDIEIEELMEKASKRINTGNTYRGMSYEEGLKDAINWLTDRDEDNPLEDA